MGEQFHYLVDEDQTIRVWLLFLIVNCFAVVVRANGVSTQVRRVRHEDCTPADRKD